MKLVQYENNGFVTDNGNFIYKSDILGCPCVGCNVFEVDDGKYQTARFDYAEVNDD